jgi:hypothetical protein
VLWSSGGSKDLSRRLVLVRDETAHLSRYGTDPGETRIHLISVLGLILILMTSSWEETCFKVHHALLFATTQSRPQLTPSF